MIAETATEREDYTDSCDSPRSNAFTTQHPSLSCTIFHCLVGFVWGFVGFAKRPIAGLRGSETGYEPQAIRLWKSTHATRPS